MRYLVNGEYDHKRRGRGPAMLVLTPTRELAKQVHDELKYLADTRRLPRPRVSTVVSRMARRKAL